MHAEDNRQGTPEGPLAESVSAGPLSGARGWLITEDKAGLVVQVTGVAEVLGLKSEKKTLAPKGLSKVMLSLGRLPFSARPGTEESLFAPPWPAIAIGAGQAAMPYLRALRKATQGKTFTLAIQATSPANADLIAAPEHDRCTGPNVITLLAAPHSFTGDRLAALARSCPPAIAALPSPRVAVLIGGDNGVYTFGKAEYARLSAIFHSLARLGAGLLVTPSRRTGGALLAKVRRALEEHPHVLWDGTGENPYPAFLAHADAFVVTADSVNMTGEACATGRPVFVFFPSGGSAKFRRFHETLARRGITRPCPAHFDALPLWSYAPIESARMIASEVERRWLLQTRGQA